MKFFELILQFLRALFGVKEQPPVEVVTGNTETDIDTPEPDNGEVVETPDNNEGENNTEDNNPIIVEDMKNRKEIEEIVKKFVEDSAKNSSIRKIDQIAVHCTATREGKEVTIDDIDVWHKNRGFNKQKISGRYCGYHFVVALDGEIMCGRDLREVGAHVSGYNSNSIGVCYVGGLNSVGQPEDTRTEEQKQSLIWLISLLKRELKITKVQGHRDYSPDKNGNGKIEPSEWIKSCPCFDAIPEYKDV